MVEWMMPSPIRTEDPSREKSQLLEVDNWLGVGALLDSGVQRGWNGFEMSGPEPMKPNTLADSAFRYTCLHVGLNIANH